VAQARPAVAKLATKFKKGGNKKQFVSPLFNMSPIAMGSFPTYPGGGSNPSDLARLADTPTLEEVPYEEPTIDVAQLEPMSGAQEISSEATAPAQVQGQQQPSPYYNPRLAELAGNLAYREEDAAAFDARNPEAAAKFAGNKAMQEYLNQRLTRERDVHPFRRFVTGVANAIPANDTSALGHFARGYRGVRGEYDKEQKAQEGTMEELAGVQGDQAIYDAIMKRGQEAGQFYNPQEADELARMTMQQKIELDTYDREMDRIRQEALTGRQQRADERAEEYHDYRMQPKSESPLTANQKLMEEWRQKRWEADQQKSSGQPDSYKQPPVSAVTEIADMQHAIQSMPPTVKEGGLFGFGGQEVPNPERVALQKRLDYFLSVYPNPNQAGQPQQIQQQGNPQGGQALENSISDLMIAVPGMTREQAMQVLSPHLPR
jgi:hypothetical protein